ncbi:DUF4132 domain-containing protein [Planctomyces sp. SH-PL14]|uniref:DUF4132 domain-containing protein n=1 Tax=Planctomyces sp. SH-PL14 TaxID=1632864 RepID=UPI00078D2DF6|nr:DUF4132 domain-containing protein [Planctomyces sp. SH-PL14]AMV18762.1 hypothetical protein VT03_12765 [Planctomyces sp. SH-PL14]
MLKAEVARERLKEFEVPDADSNDDRPRFADQILRLPKRLAATAFGLRDLDGQGQAIRRTNSNRERQKEAFEEFDALSEKERLQVLKVYFPHLTDEIAAGWHSRKSGPYQHSHTKKAFRAPGRPEATLEVRWIWLDALLRQAEQYREDVLRPEWLVAWAPYLGYGYSATQIGALAAAIVDAGGPAGDAMFALLGQCARNENEISGMGPHVVCGLLMSSRLEGWELMEKMLLAAQRQEGLRQAILESVDLAHPQAFRRILRIIVDQNLVRFAAVIRAVDVWLGYGWDTESPAAINRTLERLLALLDDPTARKKALAGTDAESIYLALWCIAFEDAPASIAPAEKLLKHKSPEIRFAALAHLQNLGLPEADAAAWQASDDGDLRIATRVLTSANEWNFATGQPQSPAGAPDAFERAERLYERLPAKAAELPEILWPWTKLKVGRETAAGCLLGLLGDRPPTRLLPYLADLDSWRRRHVIELFTSQKSWDAATRAALVELCGDNSADVRATSLAALRKIELTDPEIEQLERMLTRKAGDLRSGVIGLILKRNDADALASAGRLAASKDANQRLAGLETLRQLVEKGREVAACQTQVEEYLVRRPKPTAEERQQIDVIVRTRAAVNVLTLDNGLGLMDPQKRTRPAPPKTRKVKVITPAAIACLKDLDDLVDKHRETPIVTDTYNNQTQLLGTVTYGFPSPRFDGKPQQPDRLPLREVWEEWFQSRPKKSRDPDGLELVRAETWWPCISGYSFKDFQAWVHRKPYRAPMLAPIEADRTVTLRYPGTVAAIIRWMGVLHPPQGEDDFLMDCAEHLCAVVPVQELEALRPTAGDQEDEEGDDDDDESDEGLGSRYGLGSSGDWRGHLGIVRDWMIGLDGKETDKERSRVERLWRLQHWLDEPVPGATRDRPGADVLFAAYRAGLANLHDVADELVGPRPPGGLYRNTGFTTLSSLTRRRPEPTEQKLLKDCPEVADLVNRIRAVVLESELERGDVPTAATEVAHAIESLSGLDTLVRLMTALGKNGFKPHTGWRQDSKLLRLPTLTHLASITYPGPEDTEESFAARMKKEIKAGAFPEDRLIELAFLAPQWTKFVENYFRWDGLAEGLYWFLAHMRFMWGSEMGAQAAESAGIADEPTAETEADEDAATDGAAEGGPPRRKLSTWERLILERTALSDTDRVAGAIDVGWFQKVSAALGPKRWDRLARSARFASNAAQAKKAQLIADVLLGEASLNELIAGIEKRFLKDHVRLLGLYPLPSGAKREPELKRRFDILQAYARYARTLSGLTKPEALRSLDIGLKNLASTAGYADALRLDWAMGAGEWSDLRDGAATESKDGVDVSLSIDDALQPRIVVTKGSKELKSVPPAVKKHPPIAVLYERSRELKRQTSRQRQALEAAMCRGDEFSSTELIELSRHALVAPLLEKLVLIGDGALGYPDRGGKALRTHAGGSVAIKKGTRLRIAHPHDLLQSGEWAKWQHEAFTAGRVQPFKQVFRELYVVTKQEKATGDKSERYAGQQVQPTQGMALWGTRGWNTQDGVFKVFYEEEIVASVNFRWGAFTPLEVEGLTLDTITYSKRDQARNLKLADVPPRLFSETMRDIDLVVSVAHAGGVDPEASASTVEMRTALVRETCQLLGLKNVRIKGSHVAISGELADYSVHLGSGTVHRMPGGALCVVPVHAQHRGRLFLPFADDDPRTAEVISKVLLLARDREIQDPTILDQIRL